MCPACNGAILSAGFTVPEHFVEAETPLEALRNDLTAAESALLALRGENERLELRLLSIYEGGHDAAVCRKAAEALLETPCRCKPGDGTTTCPREDICEALWRCTCDPSYDDPSPAVDCPQHGHLGAALAPPDSQTGAP
jgi:hypothetical protein